MTPQELSEAIKSGKVKAVTPEQPTSPPPVSNATPEIDINEFLTVLYALRLMKKPLTAVPTLTPKTFLDQIQFYDDGANRRVYFYFNKTWRYATLT